MHTRSRVWCSASRRTRVFRRAAGTCRRGRAAVSLVPPREAKLPRGQSRDRVVAERDSQRRGSQWRQRGLALRSPAFRRTGPLKEKLFRTLDDRGDRNIFHRPALLLRGKGRSGSCAQNHRSGMTRAPMIRVGRPKENQRRCVHRVSQVNRGRIDATEQFCALNDGCEAGQIGLS